MKAIKNWVFYNYLFDKTSKNVQMLHDLNDIRNAGTKGFEKYDDFFKMIEIMSSNENSILRRYCNSFIYLHSNHVLMR